MFLGFIFGGTFPLLFCLFSITIWFYFDRNEHRIPVYLVTALFSGLIIDLKFLKGWIDKRYELPVWFIMGIYVFYNICIYGFFMGFPVFNLFLGVIAGYYYGKRIFYKKIPLEKQSGLINKISLFTGTIMMLVCISSGYIALAGNGAGSDLQGMFGLDFEITKTMIWGIVLIGGILLILLEFILTKITLTKTIRNHFG
jgi:hypothetical protein